MGVEGLAELGEGRVGGAVELGGQEGAGGVARAGGEVGDGGVEGVADAGYYGRVGALDVVVANAGSSAGYAPILTTSLAALRSDYETNALGPVRLFQACYELLSRSRTGMAKFVLVSSVLGSIGALDGEAGPALAYGTSKAAANFFVRKVHFEHADVVALAIHPG